VLFTHGFAAAAFPGWTGMAVCGWVSIAEGAIVAEMSTPETAVPLEE
jgi:hypothetical protein